MDGFKFAIRASTPRAEDEIWLLPNGSWTPHRHHRLETPDRQAAEIIADQLKHLTGRPADVVPLQPTAQHNSK